MKHIEAEITVKIKNGLHARPCGIIYQKALQCDLTEVFVSNGENEVDARSLISLLLLAAEPKKVLKVRASGKDAQTFIDFMREVLETDKYEEVFG